MVFGLGYAKLCHPIFNPIRHLAFPILFLVSFTVLGFEQQNRHRISIRTSAGQSFFDIMDRTAPFNQGSALRMLFYSTMEIRMPFEAGEQ